MLQNVMLFNLLENKELVELARHIMSYQLKLTLGFKEDQLLGELRVLSLTRYPISEELWKVKLTNDPLRGFRSFEDK